MTPQALRPQTPSRARAGRLVAGAALLAVLLAGCQNDEITSYTVPKPEKPREVVKALQRMLAVLVPRGDRVWFFKLQGPVKTVEQHKDEFDKFLGSVRFTDKADDPLAWDLPEGWRKGAGHESRHATFNLGPEDAAAELSVTSLGKEAANVRDNVNRWRGQLGLRPWQPAEVEDGVKKLQVGGSEGTYLDITGEPPAGGGKMPPFAGRGAPKPPVPPAAGGGGARGGLKYNKPDGWKEQAPGAVAMAAVAFQVGDGEARVTLTRLGGTAGGLRANIDRWRGQVGLAPMTDAQFQQDVKPIDVAGIKSHYVDLAGARRRILAITTTRGDETWFIKMEGPPELVGRHKAAFEAFVASVRFE